MPSNHCAVTGNGLPSGCAAGRDRHPNRRIVRKIVIEICAPSGLMPNGNRPHQIVVHKIDRLWSPGEAAERDRARLWSLSNRHCLENEDHETDESELCKSAFHEVFLLTEV